MRVVVTLKDSCESTPQPGHSRTKTRYFDYMIDHSTPGPVPESCSPGRVYRVTMVDLLLW